MIYSIESPSHKISIKKTGIELCSILSKETGTEYIWQGDPDIWGSHAPVLFPIIGALRDGKIFYKDNAYSIPKHGLVRHSDKAKLLDQTDSSLRLSLTWDEESLRLYPFKFGIEITFSITENTLQITHLITNYGEEVMFYSVGGHPAFNCPINKAESYEDYYLEFEHEETDATWLLDSNGLTTGETTAFLKNTKILPLHKRLFDNDALIFKNLNSRRVHLKSTLSGEVLSVSFDDFDYLGIWAKPGAPFVCIEPWLGITDRIDSNQKFELKEGLIRLEPNQSESKSYAITINL